jgi:hypothetical protein
MPEPTQTPADLRERYAAAIRQAVRLRLGPNVLALAADGRAVKMNYNEADAAADAAMAVRDIELQQLRDLLGEAVDWIHEGELRERIVAALDGQDRP